MRRAVHMSITFDLNAAKVTATLKQGQRSDRISRTKRSMFESTRERNQGTHHQYRSRFGNAIFASAMADLPCAKLRPPSTLGSPDQ